MKNYAMQSESKDKNMYACKHRESAEEERLKAEVEVEAEAEAEVGGGNECSKH